VVPKADRAYSERRRRLYERAPWTLWLSRMWKYWVSELRGPMIYLDSERLSRPAQQASLAHLEAQVSDPALRAKLTPAFQFGCKRILVSDDYWATFERGNVALVAEPVEEVTRTGVRTRDGAEHELDAIVFATGFDLGFVREPFPIVGRGGQRLGHAWQGGATAYKGMSVSGFPNWFVLMGPNTGPGHTSVLVYTEAQIDHVLGAIDKLRSEGLRFVDVRQVAQDRYNAGLQRRMKHMVWTSGDCHSWYLSPDGSNHSLYPGPAFEYVLRTRRFRASDYEIARF
jgi:cation diffusion facilitator CzcD-associated flavoprotein CzcO